MRSHQTAPLVPSPDSCLQMVVLAGPTPAPARWRDHFALTPAAGFADHPLFPVDALEIRFRLALVEQLRAWFGLRVGEHQNTSASDTTYPRSPSFWSVRAISASAR